MNELQCMAGIVCDAEEKLRRGRVASSDGERTMRSLMRQALQIRNAIDEVCSDDSKARNCPSPSSTARSPTRMRNRSAETSD